MIKIKDYIGDFIVITEISTGKNYTISKEDAISFFGEYMPLTIYSLPEELKKRAGTKKSII